MHLIGKAADTLGLAKPHLEQGAVPEGSELCHRPSAIASAGVCALQAAACLLDQAEIGERDGKEPKQRNLRIDQELSRGYVQRV
jgi:hypothetical protein